jgi:hypothetical protein
MYLEIIRQQERLKRLFRQADELQRNSEIDEEVKAQFIWYLCVRTSGYLEYSIKTILRKYVQSNTGSTPYIANFVNSQLDFTLNPRRDRILDLVGKFNRSWKDNLKVTTKGELSDSLTSIVNNRNLIAHGDDVNVSLKDLKKYFDDAQKVVKLIYDECNDI